MKANHVPARVRIQRRVSKLQDRLDGCFTRKRFYPKCKGCGITNVQLSIAGGKHHAGCSYQGLEAQILHYQSLGVR